MTPSPSQGDHPTSRKTFLVAAAVLLLSGILLAVGLCRYGRVPQSFTVARGSSAHEIAVQLRQERLIWHPWTFLFWVKVYAHAGAIKPGVYLLSPRDTAWRLYQKLRQGPPQMRLTFPEGWTSKQMAAHLEAHGVVSGREFLHEVEKQKLEGFLFPDTYFFPQGLTAPQVTAVMVHRFHEKEPKDMETQAKALHLSTRQIVILASIVEKEARVPPERPVIAGVFMNRLRKHWRLESCATVEYALGSWKRQLIYKDLEVESPYNTYRHMGLPPGPICNPGAAALEAAAHPAATDMMFFVADGQGTHRFSRYYKEHLAVQKKK